LGCLVVVQTQSKLHRSWSKLAPAHPYIDEVKPYHDVLSVSLVQPCWGAVGYSLWRRIGLTRKLSEIQNLHRNAMIVTPVATIMDAKRTVGWSIIDSDCSNTKAPSPAPTYVFPLIVLSSALCLHVPAEIGVVYVFTPSSVESHGTRPLRTRNETFVA
jgi:hypothetical protein